MNGEVPEIYWYLFWVGLAIVVEGFGFFMATIIHRSPSPASAPATLRLTALDQGGVPAADIKTLRAQAGTNCLMCHGK